MFNLGQEGRRTGGSGLPGMSVTGTSTGPGRSGATQGTTTTGRLGVAARSASGHAQGGAQRGGYVPKYTAEHGTGTDAINQDILRRVKAKFDSADIDGTGQLHPQEFIKAFLGILQTEDGGDAEALAKLFMRIDADSDGTIDWDEFSTYMLLESQGSARVREFESTVTMQDPMPSLVSDLLAHKDAITHITGMRLANGVDRYATCGRDGTVRLWNAKDLKHVKTLHLPRPRIALPAREGAERLSSARASRPMHSGGLWATCSAFMPLTQKLAVGSFSRSIRIYDLASYEIVGQIPEIDYVPLCLDVWVPSRAKDSELVVVGDGGGWVRLFEVRSSTGASGGADGDTISAAAAAAAGTGGSGSSVERLTERPRWRFHHHSDWVMSVKYVPDMNCVLAASLDKTVSITDAEERVPLKKLDGHHTKGVNAVDWSSLYKFVVTGSLDRRVIMWNPFSQKPLAVLSGHNAAVTGVVVNDRDNQIISMSTDHIIKIWDIRNHKCVQSLPDRDLISMPQSSGDDAVTPLLYDPDRRQLVTGFMKPKVWKMTTAGAGATQAHNAAVTRVMYNSNFSEAISADHGGTVSVWHVPSGKLRYRFLQCHGDKRITALAFDAAKRRLITGAEDGDCKIWNFSSGACLSHLVSKTKAEVTALVPLRGPLTRYVLAAGWDRRITFYEDNNAKSVGPSRSLAGHKADILAMVTLEGSSTVVTASDDGELWVWNMDSCAPKRRMLAPGTASRPANERAVEALAFLAAGATGASAGGGGGGRLRGVLVAVGADRWLRLWDVLDGTMLAERFTGHRQGETVQALALDGNNTRIATGDSGGLIKVWDISRYTGGVLSQANAATVIREVAMWRGHKSHVTSLDWVDLSIGASAGIAAAATGGGGGGTTASTAVPAHPHVLGTGGRRGLFLVSSSADCTVSLWTERGVRVGTFGQNTWSLDDPSTWVETEQVPLDERDTWIMEASRVIPRSDPAAYGINNSIPVPNPVGAENLSRPIGGVATWADGRTELSEAPSGRPPLSAAGRSSPGAFSSSKSITAAGSVIGGLGGGTAIATAAAAAAGGRNHGSLRPDSAPPEIALVCNASNAARMERRISVKKMMSTKNLIRGVGSSGAGDLPAPATEGYRKMKESPRTSSSVFAAADVQNNLDRSDQDDREEVEEDVDVDASSASSSDDHSSDTEVPTALWLAEFEAARHRRLMLASQQRDTGSGSVSRAYGAAGRIGVAHLLKVSELSTLQERPGSSFMSSRKGVATAAGVISKPSGSPTRPGTSVSATRQKT
ncbi:hypothetical protein VaNZ11_009122 [Volvox africanus]|uniref:EF-hand domain-containing protein n=1 Tax=Volvox africanus TaxID=51714 RepID=A0ABQ5S7C7_9CHLO|nr:hypothetical protein VaNZ11_009122 [Volvox africanus]